MNYQKTESIIVSQFTISNDILYYCSDNELGNSTVFSRNLKYKNTLWIVNIEGIGTIMNIYEDNLFIQDYNANLFHINIKDSACSRNLSTAEWKITLSNKLTENNYLLGLKGKLMNREYGIYDLEKNSIFFSTNQNLIGFTEANNIFIKNKTEIKCFSIELRIILWLFSLSGLAKQYSSFTQNFVQGEVWRFVGVIDNILWVDINYVGKGGALLGLDVVTGLPVHFLNELVFQNEILSYLVEGLPLNAFTQYDKDKNILFGTDTYFYWEIDLSSPTHIKMWSFEEELKKYQASFARDTTTYTTTKSHIFSITGRFGETFSSQVFAFNRETHKIDWQYKFNYLDAYVRPTKVEVSENNLFVLDSGGTLHIFEKENE